MHARAIAMRVRCARASHGPAEVHALVLIRLMASEPTPDHSADLAQPRRQYDGIIYSSRQKECTRALCRRGGTIVRPVTFVHSQAHELYALPHHTFYHSQSHHNIARHHSDHKSHSCMKILRGNWDRQLDVVLWLELEFVRSSSSNAIATAIGGGCNHHGVRNRCRLAAPATEGDLTLRVRNLASHVHFADAVVNKHFSPGKRLLVRTLDH